MLKTIQINNFNHLLTIQMKDKRVKREFLPPPSKNYKFEEVANPFIRSHKKLKVSRILEEKSKRQIPTKSLFLNPSIQLIFIFSQSKTKTNSKPTILEYMLKGK